MEIREKHVVIKRPPTKQEVRMIKRYGRRYTPALLPADMRRGSIGHCFDASMIECMRLQEKYYYVEGLAKGPDDEWALHAWLTDGTHAFDPTWVATFEDTTIPPPVKYIGIQMPLLKVLMFVRTTEYQGIIPNSWRYPQVLESIVAELA